MQGARVQALTSNTKEALGLARQNTKDYFRKVLLFTAMQVGFGFVAFIPINFTGLVGFLSSLWLVIKPELLVVIPVYALRLIPMWLE